MINAGKLLVAPPAQDDSYWAQTVIFVYEVSKNNVLGLITNKPGDRPVKDLAEHNGLDYYRDEMLHIGGPVNPQALILLHSNDWFSSNTYAITKDISVSSDKEMLERVAAGDQPKYWKMCLGMSGWTTAQLEGELNGDPPWNKKKSWLIAPSTTDVVFEKNIQRAWKKSVDSAVKTATHDLFSDFLS